MTIIKLEPVNGVHPVERQSHRTSNWMGEGWAEVPEHLAEQAFACGGSCELTLEDGVLTALTAVRRPEELDQEAFARMMEAVRRTFDICLLDAPAGVGDGFRMAAQAASLELLVTGPDPGALRDGTRTGELLELMGKRDVRLVVNRVNPKLYSAMNLTVDDVMDMVGYPLLGLVPEDRNVPLAAVHDRPLLHYARRSPAAAAFHRMAKRLQGIPAPLAGLK